MSSAGSVWCVGSFKLHCEILLLLNVADRIVTYVEGCGVTNAEYHVHLVSV